MAGSATGQKQTTYLIMFSLFLKLLGFFVVMYSYAEFQPTKVQAVEMSLKQRFNISLPTQHLIRPSGEHVVSPWVMQNAGRSYDAIADEMKTQMDFLSTEINARSGTLILTVPADIVLSTETRPAESPAFGQTLVETLKKNEPNGAVYMVQIVAKGADRDGMMRSLGNFVQSLVAEDYAPRNLTIGFEDRDDVSDVDFIIKAVPR